MFKTVVSKIVAMCIGAFVPSLFILAGCYWLITQFSHVGTALRTETNAVLTLSEFTARTEEILHAATIETFGGVELSSATLTKDLRRAKEILEKLGSALSGGSSANATQRIRVVSGRLGDFEKQFILFKAERKTIQVVEKEFATLLLDAENKIKELTSAAFDNGGQEYIAFISSIEKAFLRSQLRFGEFLAVPTESADKAAELALKKFRQTTKSARTTFRSVGRAEATDLFKIGRQLDRLWRDVSKKVLAHKEIVRTKARATSSAIKKDIAGLNAAIRDVTKAQSDVAQERANRVSMYAGILALFYLVIASVVLFVFTRVLRDNMMRLIAAMTKIAEGDHSGNIEAADRNDELGKMARALLVFQRKAADQHKNELELRERRDNERREQAVLLENEKRRTTNELADQFERDVNEVASKLNVASEQLVSLSKQMKKVTLNATQFSNTATKASGGASEKVDATVQVSKSLKESIDKVSGHVDLAVKSTENALQVTNQMGSKTSKLENSAAEVRNIVSLIDDIAHQTNLLSLNASIEASRAGAAGKGFAVVAGEVKNLADQTAQATERVVSYITAIEDDTADVVAALQDIDATFSEMNETSQSVSNAMDSQGEATEKISGCAILASKGMGEVSRHLTVVGEAVDQTNVSAARIMEASSELSEMSDVLAQSMGKFLVNLRAA